MDQRQVALHHWLTAYFQPNTIQLIAIPGDASFRRYFRVWRKEHSYIAMDAPPERENCVPFVSIAKALRTANVASPEIIHANLDQGFLLLSDFGDMTFLKALHPSNAMSLYTLALNTLAILQNCRHVEGWHVPLFTASFITDELRLFQEWFLQTHLQLVLSSSVEKMLSTHFTSLAESATHQPQVFMHRDYHSANLMQLPNDEVGVLDFQDAFIGPLTYDLVSLLRDCYVDWPPPWVSKLALDYCKLMELQVAESEFLRWFDWMGLQRHMKALLTFSRKYHRDGNAHYLQYIPRTLNYLKTVSARYPELKSFSHYVCDTILPAYEKVSRCAP